MNNKSTSYLLKTLTMERHIAIASDHAGYTMKLSEIEYLKGKGYVLKDSGTDSEKPVNYPEYGHPLASAVENGDYPLGISLCGSGNGINMVTNKHQGIRAALCWNKKISELARLHNDANICSMPARFIDYNLTKEIVITFLNTNFEGGRHQRRIEKIPVQ